MKIVKIILFTVMLILPCLRLEASAYLPIYKASFWIGRLGNPDEPILTPAQIEKMNNTILDENDEMANITELGDTVSRQDLIEWLFKDPIPQDKEMFDRKGRVIKGNFYKDVMDNMNTTGVTESNGLIFGVITKKADIRAFPTDEPILKSPSAKDFDAFQYSAIYPPQPVALLHKSKDGKWGFFQTPFVRGWIKMDKIAFANKRDDINPHASPLSPSQRGTGGGAGVNQHSLVITGSRVMVFRDKKNNGNAEIVPMGNTFVLQGEDKNYWIVKFPKKDKDGQLQWIEAYIKKKADIHIGYLTYTKRNVINQAFKMLGEGYGWGGRNGLRDCSSFIKDVFAAMGISLPRHSSHQAASGQALLSLDEAAPPEDINSSRYVSKRERALDSAVPGITLLGLSGHIMLYLGNINGSYYSLHQFFGYHDKDGFRTINKAVVTNLELGKGSKMGPIKNRIKSVNLLILDETN
ncbi:MAG: SH3 domain-containing protein [Deltaproteobacteria bacterium]